MIIYWLYFLFPAILALAGKSRISKTLSGNQSLRFGGLWWFFVTTLTLLIGLRHEVGGDWKNYIRIFSESSQISSISFQTDPGYQIINYISSELGFGIYGVNLFCAFIFSIGLSLFCRSLPRPLLGLAVAIPFLVVVVSMGYTRQAVALGFAMIGLVFLGRDKKLSFVCYIILAATIHKSAILLLPISVLASTKNRLWGLVWIGIVAISLFIVFVADVISNMITNYSDLDDPASQADGAFIRLAMNLVPSVIFLLFRKRFNMPDLEKSLWMWFSIISIFLMLLFFIIPVSTALDRVALYMIPLQMVIFSYLPDIFGRKNALHRWIMILIISYYSLVLFVWLNFANHAQFWLPYQNLLFLW